MVVVESFIVFLSQDLFIYSPKLLFLHEILVVFT